MERGPLSFFTPLFRYSGNCLKFFYLFHSSQMTGVTRLEAPKFDGASTAFANYEEKVSIWKKIATLGPDKRAAHLLLHMSDVARKVLRAGG